MGRPISLPARIALALAMGVSLGCATAGPDAPAPLSRAERERVDAFRADLEAARARVGVRRLAAAVVRDGRVEWASDASASFPLGTLTQAFSAVAALRLAERGTLDLDAPVADLDPSFPGPRTVLVRHLLSQTSEEVPGTTLLFDPGAFERLTGILASASGTSFAALLEAEALRPPDSGGRAAAQAGPGLTASTGLASSVRDLARLEAALVGDGLLKPDSLRRMTSPTFTANGFLPYGMGWFVTWSANERMVWAFGESDGGSALFFRLPDRGLALILLADGPGLARPFHLDLANPLRSPFVLAFLRRFVPLGEEVQRLLAIDALVDQALVLQWRNDPGAAAAFRTALASRGGFAAPDPALLAALARTTEPDLLAAGETIGRQIQAGGWDNARTLLDLAILQVHAGRPAQAAEILNSLLARPNVRDAKLLAETRRLLAETAPPR